MNHGVINLFTKTISIIINALQVTQPILSTILKIYRSLSYVYLVFIM